MSTTKKSIPLDGIAGLKQNFSKDALSGFLVFLIALPLSLGIAKASDFPPVMGLVTAIIGGMLVSIFMGSKLTIKGPAAGLIAIASGAVLDFGGGESGWHLALGAIVVAGGIQVLFGVFKLGKLADFFPSSAVHGMLAAIGIIIMSKQIHTLLGINPAELKGKEPLELLAMIPSSIMHENAHIAEIGGACLAIIIIMSLMKHRVIKAIPAPLVVLAVSIPLGIVLHLKTDGTIQNFALVKVGNLFEKIGFNSDFSGLTANTGVFLKYVMMFALIGSIESLLTAKAIDGLDPYKRKSDFDKDLSAVGVGNILAALLGGLPMISEVARSSANVANGAQTRWANFFHGAFLLLFLLIAVPIMEMIPNAALAAMLIFVGFRLAHPKEFTHAWHIGKEQFVVFVATVIITLATDLLIGVASGIIVEILFNMAYGAPLKHIFYAPVNVIEKENSDLEIIPHQCGVFSNLIGLKRTLYEQPQGKNIIINLSSTKFVDHTTIVALELFANDYADQGGNVTIEGINEHIPLSNHKHAGKRLA